MAGSNYSNLDVWIYWLKSFVFGMFTLLYWYFGLSPPVPYIKTEAIEFWFMPLLTPEVVRHTLPGHHLFIFCCRISLKTCPLTVIYRFNWAGEWVRPALSEARRIIANAPCTVSCTLFLRFGMDTFENRQYVQRMKFSGSEMSNLQRIVQQTALFKHLTLFKFCNFGRVTASLPFNALPGSSVLCLGLNTYYRLIIFTCSRGTSLATLVAFPTNSEKFLLPCSKIQKSR